MKVYNYANLESDEFTEVEKIVAQHESLAAALRWATSRPRGECVSRIVANVVAQDEFTNDVVIPWRNLYLVYDTT